MSEFFTDFYDNWYYFIRVGLIQYNTKWQKKWVEYLGAFCAFSSLLLNIIDKFISCYKEALVK